MNQQISLEGLRSALLAPCEITRDEEGYWTHPALPILDEDASISWFLQAFGIESSFVAMEAGADSDLLDRYFYGDNEACAAWTPTTPNGAGWLLLAIYDTESGPYALFARDADNATHSHWRSADELVALQRAEIARLNARLRRALGKTSGEVRA